MLYRTVLSVVSFWQPECFRLCYKSGEQIQRQFALAHQQKDYRADNRCNILKVLLRDHIRHLTSHSVCE